MTPLRDVAAIAGVGATPVWKRGGSAPRTETELVCTAILAALDDCGLTPQDVDGFAYFAGGYDSALLMEVLGIPDLRFSAALTGTGGGSAGAVGLAATAIATGQAEVVVVVGGQVQGAQRYGTITAGTAPDPLASFVQAAGLVGPGHLFALIARRHMHLYGTTREAFCAVALSTRANAAANPAALIRKPLTREDYFAAPMIADPHCLYDFCLETDAMVALVVTSAARARDLRQPPALIRAAVHGGRRDWGRSLYWMNMPDAVFAGSGHDGIAPRLWSAAGLGPGDVDCAQIYDHFTSQVILQLEDYGFCPKGEGGRFVLDGAIGRGGALPVNTDGGQLSAGYAWGLTHVAEAVAQIRGTSANPVPGAAVVLVTGGPSSLPLSALILRRDG
ncbi:MAG: thiolase C-terminal domain-containing protein [Gemmobacter sp.]